MILLKGFQKTIKKYDTPTNRQKCYLILILHLHCVKQQFYLIKEFQHFWI